MINSLTDEFRQECKTKDKIINFLVEEVSEKSNLINSLVGDAQQKTLLINSLADRLSTLEELL